MNAAKLFIYPFRLPFGPGNQLVMAVYLNAGIQFIANKQYNGVPVHPKHKDYNSADGAIQLIELAKMVNVGGENQGCGNGKHRSEYGAGGKEPPPFMGGRAVIKY